MTDGNNATGTGEQTRRALRRLTTLVLDGLKHGFFDASVSVKTSERKRRELVISAGRNYKYSIPESELK